MTTLLLFIVVLGLLVFVHELGHFCVARFYGVKADEFGFGFPPRFAGYWKDETTGRYRFVWGNKDIVSKNTVYSLNWIPLGGFVKIKGEDGSGKRDPDSFAIRHPLVRIQILAAGVVMNFLLAWLLIAGTLTLGFPQAIDPDQPLPAGETPRIQISQVAPGSPAEAMGLKMGDLILRLDGEAMESVPETQAYIAAHKGEEISFKIERNGEALLLRGMPRLETPEGEGALGVALNATVVVEYGWGKALVEGAKETYHLTLAMLEGIGRLLKGLVVGEKESFQDVAGPLGIAYLTKEVSTLGLAYLLFFAAILSINLGIINILPFPALDGGRVLFVLIEMVKGSPVSHRVEGWFHQLGFLFLLVLMVLVTVHDFTKFKVVEKLQALF